jgi:dihydrofolate reductase
MHFDEAPIGVLVALSRGLEKHSLLVVHRSSLDAAMSFALAAGSSWREAIRPKGSVMRKVIASLFVSLDGVVEKPERWHFPYFNEEMGAAIGQAMSSTDAFLLGRRTYEEWAAFWPSQSPEENPMAAAINGLPKFVASTTLNEVTWENSTLLGDDVAGEVEKLKRQPGKDIVVSGSATLVRSLLQEGVLDELRLMIHPVVVGSGGRLFEDGEVHAALDLVGSETFSTGVLNLTYRPTANGSALDVQDEGRAA